MSARPPRPPTRPALDLVPIHGNRGLHDSFFCLFSPCGFFPPLVLLPILLFSFPPLILGRSRPRGCSCATLVLGAAGLRLWRRCRASVGGEDLSSPVCPPGLPAVASSRACRKSSAQQVIDIIENNKFPSAPPSHLVQVLADVC